MQRTSLKKQQVLKKCTKFYKVLCTVIQYLVDEDEQFYQSVSFKNSSHCKVGIQHLS